MRWDGCENEELLKWDGYSSDTYFSGLLVRYAGDEHVVVAWFYVYDAIL
jgi:hypothetical protein